MQELKKENFDLKLRLYMTQKNGEVSIIVISYLIFHIIIEFKALRRIQSNMYDGAFICDILDVIQVLNTSLLRLVSKYQFKVNNPFHVTGLFLNLLETANLWLSVFRVYRTRPVVWNGVKRLYFESAMDFINFLPQYTQIIFFRK